MSNVDIFTSASCWAPCGDALSSTAAPPLTVSLFQTPEPVPRQPRGARTRLREQIYVSGQRRAQKSRRRSLLVQQMSTDVKLQRRCEQILLEPQQPPTARRQKVWVTSCEDVSVVNQRVHSYTTPHIHTSSIRVGSDGAESSLMNRRG